MLIRMIVERERTAAATLFVLAYRLMAGAFKTGKSKNASTVYF